jgi:biotin carboxyl carrier protein
MPGKVVAVLVRVGEEVVAGQGVVVIEAMKMENELKAAAPGRVAEVRAVAGKAVNGGEVLVVLE